MTELTMSPPAPPMDDVIVFPEFWMFRNEGGWRWVSRDGSKSSRAAFDFAHACLKDAARAFNPAP